MNIGVVPPTTYSTMGNWSGVIPWTPHIPTSAALLPDGRLLTFASNQRTTFPDGPQFTFAAVWDPATGLFTEINNGRHDMFCGGLSLLQDGRLLVNGGNGITGTTALASLFDWRTNEWVPAQTMADGRWYNTTISLPNGEVLTAGGNGGANGNGTIEQWNASSGWRRMSGINWQAVANPPIANAIETNWHPFFLVAPDGRVAHFGPHQSLDWITATGTGSMTTAGASIPGTHYPKQGAWAMYDAGKVIVAGGLQAIDNGTVVNKAFTIDLNGATPVLTPAAPMANARSFSNSVMLPNGEVMIVGGNTSGQFFSDVGAVFTPEIWNPTTGQWRGVADLTVPRNYHSLAMLLPDGRVWSGGGGLSGDPLTDHQDAQVFTPPQLFNADGTFAVRPLITAAPDRISPASVFTVNASNGVQYFSAISMSAQTHSVSTGLRHVRFTHTNPSAGVYAVTAPSSINVLTPGYWMMFAVDANGVWSVSRIIQVTNSTLPVVTNPGPQSVNQNSVVSLPINATATGGTLAYSATGLPDGLTINTGSGLISGTVTAVPGTYRSTILVTAAGQVTSVSFNWIVVLPNLGSGQIMREYWTDVTGETVASLTSSAVYPSNPNGRDMLTSFEAPSNWDQQTGQRARGFLYVPVTGQYQLFIASDNQSSLLLSSDANPANAVQIASQPDWTPPETWTWYPQQASALITLQAGKRYYIEALVKNGAGGDNLSVGWLKPGDTAVTVIGGTYLSPYLPVNNPVVGWSFEEASWNGTAGEVKPTAASLFALTGMASGAIPTAANPALSGNPGTGSSAQFNGTGQSVVMPFNAALNPNDFTIAAWVRSDAVPGTAHCILSSRGESTAILRGYSLWVTTDGQWQLRTGADASGLKGGPVTVGQWTHVAATFHTTSVSGTTLTGLRRIYLNGTLVAEDTSTYVPNTAQPLVIGAADSPGAAFFAGAVDEVALYQSPLSQPDILALRDLRHATSTVLDLPPQITYPGAQASLVSAVVSLPVIAVDPENNPITFSATGLPTGLSISAASGVISGTVTTAGAFNVTVLASDGLSTPSSASFLWNVSAGLTLQPLTDAPKASGAALTFNVQSANGIHPRYKWNFGDGTPETAWLTTTSITHTYAGPGRYLVTLTATDDTGILVTSTFYQAVYAAPTARKPAASSSIVYEHPTTGNDRVWCVNPDNNSVSAFDVVTKTRYAEITVGTSPRCLAFAPDGRLWVTNVETATISIINTSTRAVVATVTLASGSRPFGIAFDPAGTAAWVAQEVSGKVLKLNTSTGAQIASIDAGGPVRHLSISADSASLYASRFITPLVPGENTGTPVLTGTGGQVVVIGTASLTVQRTILLNPSTAQDTSTSARGLPNYLGAAVISPDGLSAWVPSKQDNIQRGVYRDGQQLNHENTVRAIVSRIDLTAQAESLPSRVDIDNSGMPSAAAYDPWGNYIFTALEASRAVAILDAWSHKEILRFPAGRAPQGVVVSPDGNTLFVQNYMDRTITVHDVSGILLGAATAPVTTAALNTVTTEMLSAQVLKGKQFFFDAQDPRLALQQYISCAVCHNDAGHDGRVWDLTGFGEGLRNTITLKGHANQGMLHWSGNFDEVQDFEGQIRTLAGGTGLMTDAQFNTGRRSQPLGDPKAGVSPDLDALAAYVKSLTTNGTSPNRTTAGALSVAAAAGQQIFRAQNCAACHSGAAFTNSALNVFADIGTNTPGTGTRLGGPLTGFDVPTLRGTWATAPYLHDGSAPTLSAAITAHKGLTLSASDLSYLTAFVASIDDAPATAPLPFTLTLSTPATTVTGTFTVTATFNAAATGFTLSKVVLTNGTASTFSGSGASYTFQVKPTAAGPVTISVPALAAKDSTNLGNSASNLLSVNYAPAPLTVVLSTPASSVAAPFVVNATFSESVTGLLASKFSVTNGTVTALSSAGAVWSATVTPAAAGNVTVSLPAGMAQSASGKPNLASNLITVNYVPPVSTHGLTGDYYVGKNFDHFSFSRTDATLDFTWGEGSPDPRIPVDGFSVRWHGWITPRYTDTYTLIPVTDDGVRLWVNGQLVVNDWNDHGATWNNGVVTLQAGVPVSIVMEYYEDTDSATARLLWESNNQTREVIPQSLWLINAPVVTKATITGSGSTNLLGTALGTSPNSGINSPGRGLQLATRNNSSVDATLLHPAGQSGMALSLEITDDLINWTPLVVRPTVASQGGGLELLTWADLQALPGQSLARGIIRLRVTQSGAGTAVSTPVGWQQTLLHSGTQSFGLNLTREALFTGTISSTTSSSVTLSEQAALVTAMNPAQQYYLEIISGPQAGHRLDLETITGTACILLTDSPGTTLPASAMAGLAGATVNLRPHCTLGAVFAPARFQGSTIPTSADQVLFYTSSGYSTYWLYALGSTRYWVLSGAPMASMNDTLIQPGTGVMLQLASTNPAPLLFTGSVRTTPFARPLVAGYNLIANPWPLDTTPTHAGLTTPFCVATTSFATADQLQIWKGDASAATSGYAGFWLFQHPGQLIPTWVSNSDATLISQNNATLLHAGRATFIKAQSKASRPVWIIPPP